MHLGQLLTALCDSKKQLDRYAHLADREVTAITNDSRLVKPGAMFVALTGYKTDGHHFIDDAVRRGATVLVCERPDVTVPDTVLRIVRPDARRRLSSLADLWHGQPTRSLHLTGITGTNGKTTTAFRLWGLLEADGRPTGLLGTIEYRIGQRRLPARNTTPGALPIQDLFRQMVDENLSHAVAEISSHALALHRVDDVAFNIAVFTSLSDREHLDFHKTPENYFNAKARLFEMLPANGHAVVNLDDPLGQEIADRAPRTAHRVWFGLHPKPKLHVTAEALQMDLSGTTYRLHTPQGQAPVRTPFIGRYNVLNDLAAAAAAYAAGLSLPAIVAGLHRPDPVPGRLERVPAPDLVAAVDYAHNENALNSVLETVRAVAPRRLLLVFGAGGDRDKTKRGPMGAAAEKYADLIFLTADNSRSEQTTDILEQIQQGMTTTRPCRVIPDREMAIRAAVHAAQPGDCLLVAGKGHETYQILGDVTRPFDDRDVLRRAIAERETALQHTSQPEA